MHNKLIMTCAVLECQNTKRTTAGACSYSSIYERKNNLDNNGLISVADNAVVCLADIYLMLISNLYVPTTKQNQTRIQKKEKNGRQRVGVRSGKERER